MCKQQVFMDGKWMNTLGIYMCIELLKTFCAHMVICLKTNIMSEVFRVWGFCY